MISPSKLTVRAFAAGMALAMLPFGFAQISDSSLESIFQRLNGDDYDARYAARMDLQHEVAVASAPGNEAQQPLVEAQLLELLESEELLTTKLWILRQLESIGSEKSLTVLEGLLTTEDVELVKGAKMAIERISPTPAPVPAFLKDASISELAEIARTSENPAERFIAFSLLSKKKAKVAAAVMAEADESAPDFIRVAMTSSNSGLQKKAFALLASSGIEKQIVIMGALKRGAPAAAEKVLFSLLGSENETLELQTIEALGRVGSVKSLDVLLPLIDSKSRDIRDAAADALAMIPDTKVDVSLRAMLESGAVEEQILALKALSLRASPGVNKLVNTYAADTSVNDDLREEAISNMELVGDVDSFPILVDIVINGKESGLRKDAQKTLKRMSLRLADPEAAWASFADGFKASEGDVDTQLALMLVSDSAPSKDAIEYLKSAWASGDARIQKMVLRVLPTWRNWDAGFALLDLATAAGDDVKLRSECFKGIGKLILGSDATFPMAVKFDLAAAALEQAQSQEERESVITGFRYSTWRERVHVTYNEVDPELKVAVLEYAKD